MDVFEFTIQFNKIVKQIVLWASTSQMALYRSVGWLLADAEERWYSDYKRQWIV